MNFCAVAMALNDQGYCAKGVRIDSGDLAYLSCLARETFNLVSERFQIPWFKSVKIVASNDINEETILSLNEQGHKIDCFGIGTHLGNIAVYLKSENLQIILKYRLCIYDDYVFDVYFYFLKEIFFLKSLELKLLTILILNSERNYKKL